MSKFQVTIMTVMSTTIEVEADDRETAIDEAFEQAPSPAWDWPDIGEWQLPSEMFPKANRPEDDVFEVTK
jgi:hypothetical protein